MSWAGNSTSGLTCGMQGSNMDGMKRRQDSGHSPDIRVARARVVLSHAQAGSAHTVQ
jgi:hypothetical protein